MKQKKIDFFDSAYQKEMPRKDSKFGIIDDGKIAFTSTSVDERQWNAIVLNEANASLQFTPVDHNIVVKNEMGNELSQCDGMINCGNCYLAFVELKKVNGKWIEEAIRQLESTIHIFAECHDTESFARRFAYAANRQRPRFHFSEKSRMQKFHNKTGFRLLIQNEISVNFFS
jgi:hypothetical protein